MTRANFLKMNPVESASSVEAVFADLVGRLQEDQELKEVR